MSNPTSTEAPALLSRPRPLKGFFERVPVIAGTVVVVLGVLVLLGWAVNAPLVVTPLGDSYPMLPLSAVCFVFAGASLIIGARTTRTSKTEAIQQTLAALVSTIAGLTLYEYLRGGESRFDLLLFGSRVHQVSVAPAGRIAINTAGTFLLFGLALLSLSHDQRKRDFRAQLFVAPGLLIALAAILGYVYGVKDMYAFTSGSGMALVTTIGMLVLGSGILVAVRDRGIAALLIDEGAAGVLTRRLLPAALFAPIVLGFIRVAGETAGIYDSDVGVSLFAVLIIITFVGLVLWSARVLRDTDKERIDLLALEMEARAHAEWALKEAEEARSD
ncbi:MAG TPA: hypothetical protein VJ865_13130, partial [Gemmatimonadaceae bacterium]|nr:hypothetical protein [Gemmatimonadaceae bacterium]